MRTDLRLADSDDARELARRRALRAALTAGASALVADIEAEREAYRRACRGFARVGRPAPPPDLPRVSEPRWLSWAARRLSEVDDWVAHPDLVEALGFDPVLEVLARLRSFPEFAAFATAAIELRWTSRPRFRRDALEDAARLGRTLVVSDAERGSWTGEGPAPWYRLELSIPWVLLAEAAELERALHDLLMYCGVRGEKPGKPVVAKPDISAHAATIARYGVGDAREASVVAHALARPNALEELRAFDLDPETGQGLLWGPGAAPRRVVREVAPVVDRKAAAANQGREG